MDLIKRKSNKRFDQKRHYKIVFAYYKKAHSRLKKLHDSLEDYCKDMEAQSLIDPGLFTAVVNLKIKVSIMLSDADRLVKEYDLLCKSLKPSTKRRTSRRT